MNDNSTGESDVSSATTWRPMLPQYKRSQGMATLNIDGGVDSVLVQGRDGQPLDVTVTDNNSLAVKRDGNEVTFAVIGRRLIVVVGGA